MAKAKGKVDILACVKRMREKRLNMVQTVAQYKFIYHTLLEALVCGDTSVPTQNLRAHVSALEGTNSSNHTGFTGEFQKLAKFCTLYNIHTCKEGVKPANKSKNRNQKILPADIFRPSLMTLTNKDGTPGYINAVFVDTYSKKEGFIVTQLPLKETITDFWSLVFDYKCNSLIVMNQVQELGELLEVSVSDQESHRHPQMFFSSQNAPCPDGCNRANEDRRELIGSNEPIGTNQLPLLSLFARLRPSG
nr:PREDICTED: receptor-type tyrosine-protein phosphatase mu-like [Latimeria chalumnae]|eukprot:XP_014347537.1 PREDICTED: receptor-type tyrosine-protein phosphatase mu-like [Latimeria chalumnae]